MTDTTARDRTWPFFVAPMNRDAIAGSLDLISEEAKTALSLIDEEVDPKGVPPEGKDAVTVTEQALEAVGNLVHLAHNAMFELVRAGLDMGIPMEHLMESAQQSDRLQFGNDFAEFVNMTATAWPSALTDKGDDASA